jgi:hypothetical protein
MSDCACLPGDEENHWFEIRCPECVKVESEQWVEMMKNFDQTLDIIRQNRQT